MFKIGKVFHLFFKTQKSLTQTQTRTKHISYEFFPLMEK